MLALVPCPKVAQDVRSFNLRAYVASASPMLCMRQLSGLFFIKYTVYFVRPWR